MDKLLRLIVFCFICLHLNAANNFDPLFGELPAQHHLQNFAHEASNCSRDIDNSDLPLHSKSLLQVLIRLVENGYQPLTGETFEQSVKRIYKLRVSQGKNTTLVNENLPLVAYVKGINHIANAGSKELEHYMKCHNLVVADMFETDSNDTNNGSWCACLCCCFKAKI